MFKFLKILGRNLKQGPSTQIFPLGEAPTPKRFRGRVVVDPSKCVGCGICKHVCAGRAINIEPDKNKQGYSFSVWHNTCALCGMCRHYCPTKAITLSNDWHNAHLQSKKYDNAEHHFIPYSRCRSCDAPMRRLPPELVLKIYTDKSLDMMPLLSLCPQCRQVATAEREAPQVETTTQEPLLKKETNDE
ncbi:4Fe-4S dicluster domain-containing protein [Desulfovibrio litoralis]|uniref:Formate hydrogenlyase subunit 6/NADH:ubiquinone oxidoreductase subunit (Chain I) n=1 Tax=Desulfovibrio litoralis DSM 11393 TaxID=1121455 RepID=A0A1M7S1E9_9BACT|nr:4Fe-4S dicluster domain-containing protein [Desulfovibrio litoralis]SHN52276.1 Formate hydrogenlyase subunit 6/NADH:ubiquinone oxidoreductase subunit (chain I) [Desulfovibrio litoralis DSM 11393]